MKSDCETCLQNLNWAIGLNRLSLRLMGVWPEDDVVEAKFLTTILRIPLMMLVIFWFTVVPQVYALVLVRKNLLLVIDNIMSNSLAFTCVLKLYFFWRCKEVLRPVVGSITKDWLRSKTDWEYHIMKNMAAKARLFTIGGYTLVIGCLLGFAIAPLCSLNIRVDQNITDYGKHQLLFQSYYPYDYSKSPNFELTHLSQVIAGCFIGMTVAVPDNYFETLVFHLSSQFEILGFSVEHCIRQDNKHLKVKTLNKNLGVYVSRHVHLIRMVSAVEESFTFTILIQLFCTCLVVCCLGVRILYSLENAGKGTSITQMINLGGALMTFVLFTFNNCYASETLTSCSAGILHHVYSSTWYMVPTQNTRDLILLMIMSKNPQTLTAGKMVYLSLENFCGILKTIAGYISVLIAHSR